MAITPGSFSFNSVLINYSLSEISALNEELQNWKNKGIHFPNGNVLKFFDRIDINKPYRVSKHWLHNPRLSTPYLEAIHSFMIHEHEPILMYMNFECLADIAASELNMDIVKRLVMRVIREMQQIDHYNEIYHKRVYFKNL
jgi:hypothetical protein